MRLHAHNASLFSKMSLWHCVLALLAGFLASPVIAKETSAWAVGDGMKEFRRLEKLGVSVPGWFLIPNAPPSPADKYRPTTPADKTVSTLVNIKFNAGADQPSECEVLMTNASADFAQRLCGPSLKIRIKPEMIRQKPAQAHFWIHVYDNGESLQSTLTGMEFSPS